MFCKKCGAEVQEHWNVCTRCGQRLRYEQDNRQKSESITKLSYVDTSESAEADYPGENTRNTARILLKIFAVITFVCFFCPLYMFSCAGQELFELSGREMAFGFQYMDEEMSGNLIFAFLAVIPLFGVLLSFQNSRKLEIRKDYKEMKELFMGSAVLGGGNLFVIVYFTYVLKQAFMESAVEVSFCLSMNVMIMASLLSLFVGGCQTCQMEIREKGDTRGKGAIILECCGSIIGECFSIFLIVFLISYFTGATELDMQEEDYLSRKTSVIEVSAMLEQRVDEYENILLCQSIDYLTRE